MLLYYNRRLQQHAQRAYLSVSGYLSIPYATHGTYPPKHVSAGRRTEEVDHCVGARFILQIFGELTDQHGVEFFDTAEGYGGGTSEERLRDMVAWGRPRKVRAEHAT